MTRTTKQYSLSLDQLDQLTLDKIRMKLGKTASLMNLVTTKYKGPKSYLKLFERPTALRDQLRSKGLLTQFNLRTRSEANTIRDALTNLKAMWSNAFDKVRELVNQQLHAGIMTDHEAHYIRYILKSRELVYRVLNGLKFEVPQSINYNDINPKKLNNYIRRTIRKYKQVPYTKSDRQFPIEAYSRKGTWIKVEGLNGDKRIQIPLTHSQRLTPNRLVSKGNRVEIHCTSEVKVDKSNIVDNKIGIDQGYRNLLATSSGNLYGEKFSELVSSQVDKQTKKGKKRNKLRALEKKFRERSKDKSVSKRKRKRYLAKARRIKKNNLGNKKWSNKSRRYDSRTKNFINHSLNQFYKTERPSELVHENLLSLIQRKDNGLSKKVRNRLNKWRKGYLQERIEFKSHQFNCLNKAVNPAYTSQMHHVCGRLGSRQGDVFTCDFCQSGNVEHADINAAKNILQRDSDPEITLYTKYTKVKEIILSRYSDHNQDEEYSSKEDSWTSKSLDTFVGGKPLYYGVNQTANLDRENLPEDCDTQVLTTQTEGQFYSV